MDPLELMIAASKRIAPTFLNYEIGSDVESVIYHLIKRLREDYEEFVIISFQDAYFSISRYLGAIYDDVHEVFRGAHLISVNPYLEEELKPRTSIKTKDAEIIVGRLGAELRTKSNTLFLVLGLDLYGVKYPQELPVIIPAIIRVLSSGGNNNIIISFNTKIFPESTTEMVNSFALNLFKFEVEVENSDIKRKFSVIRCPFVEYTLKSWYYTVTPKRLIFVSGSEKD